ncbi:MAG: signal peptidase I [Tenericutes bacterium HGW-Tenericutes-8]|nr:MAG: signal peptidase I [Tenericutes bacterium HGW-Tenericutes-8]
MKIKEIIKLIDANEENEVAIKSLRQKHLFKWVSLGLVAAVVFGLSLVYLVKEYQTFSSRNQKLLLISISAFAILLAVYQVWFMSRDKITLKKAYDMFKIADTLTFFGISLLIIFHVMTFYFFTAEVNHRSMMPTLSDGDRLIVYQFDYQPVRNDVVVIYMDANHYDGADDTHYVKRIIGMPGDYISVSSAGVLIINNEEIQQVPATYLEDIRENLDGLENNQIPEGFYFVLGDNVDNSHDSRALGFIYEEDIVAKVVFRFYKEFGGVS